MLARYLVKWWSKVLQFMLVEEEKNTLTQKPESKNQCWYVSLQAFFFVRKKWKKKTRRHRQRRRPNANPNPHNSRILDALMRAVVCVAWNAFSLWSRENGIVVQISYIIKAHRLVPITASDHYRNTLLMCTYMYFRYGAMVLPQNEIKSNQKTYTHKNDGSSST